MPELPEIETLRRDLSEFMTGAIFERVSVHRRRSVRAHVDPGEFEERLAGAKVVSLKRKGKFLSFCIERGDGEVCALVAHMGMSGQLRRFSEGDVLPKHSHVRFHLADGCRLVFVDPRTFGQMYVDGLDDQGFAVSLKRLGVDPLNDGSRVHEAAQRFTQRSVGIKWQLLDQTIVCGIGNMYADEILFRAGIRFDRPGNSISDDELCKLASAIPKVLGEAVALRGSSLRDLQYRDVNGEIGGFQAKHRAYGREGHRCLRCDGMIERVFSKGRSSFLCSSCQR